MSASRTSLETMKIGRQLLSANVAVVTHVGQAESGEREAQPVREAIDSKLGKANSGTNQLFEFSKRQEVSYLSV